MADPEQTTTREIEVNPDSSMEDVSLEKEPQDEGDSSSVSVPEIVTEDAQPSADTDGHEQEPPTPKAQEPISPRTASNLQSPQTTEPPTPSTPDFVDSRPAPNRTRTDSQSTAATTATTATTRPSTRSSLVFVVTALETIAASKDAKKNTKLRDATGQALQAIKGEGDPSRINPEVLFSPLQLASEAYTVSVVITALDCIGKLISYSYFSNPTEAQADTPEGPPLIERAIDTICDCFQGEATPPDVQLQIVKSLLAAILNDKIVVHGAGLLKAVRQTYNVFMLSKSTANQSVAQTALTQMVTTVFERVKGRLLAKESRMNLSRVSLEKSTPDVEGSPAEANGSPHDADASVAIPPEVEQDGESKEELPSDTPVEEHTGPKITLQSFENSAGFNDDKIHDNAPTLVTRLKGRTSRSVSGQESNSDSTDEDEEDEIYMRDAFLVFRAMCRLSTKSLPKEHALDITSQSMRSKLLSLHMIHILLHNNVTVFLSPYAVIRNSSSDEPVAFVQSIKQYLCLSLSRNGASSVKNVFEISCDIFWLMLKYLRVMLKKEVEVFLKEIYLMTLEKRNAAVFQKRYILKVLSQLAEDPRALVEIYLNYDCDRTALDNMFQKIVEHLSRISGTPVAITPAAQQIYMEQRAKSHGTSDWASRGGIPPSLATASMHNPTAADMGYPEEYALKQESLEALIEILRSLVNWSQPETQLNLKDNESRNSFDDLRKSIEARDTASPYLGGLENGSGSGLATPVAEDDPSQLEKAKQRKTALTNAVRAFNFKPKKGLKVLIKDGFIKSDSPQDIARFFLTSDQLDKKALGEFLGEGDEENVAIMHAFVDLMDFTRTRFTDALRRFLQTFRLPGEAQKIDRFMLKFATRYMDGNPNAFANADTPYVLAYSVIMLNVDQHSSKIKGNRMTPEDFIKNNRGINDGGDLPEEYLRGIHEEIAKNEIVLDTEQQQAANLAPITQPQPGGLGGAFVGGRDLQREAYMQASEEMANKTEQLYRSLLKAQRRGAAKVVVSKFIPATSTRHVGPMFAVTWMPFFTALSGQAQDTQNLELVRLCMEGLRLAVRIACLFDLEDPRQALVAVLAKFTNLYNISEMKAKNMEALKVLLEVAHQEGDHLKDSWRDVLTCISQLDRFQLISTGVDQDVVPDVLKANVSSPAPKRSLQVPNQRHRPRAPSGTVHYQSDIAEESRSANMVRSVDKIFTNSANLSGEAIVYFVKALTQVSWQEIQSSGLSESPRTYSLQKIVEISGYNMTRVRFEWTNIWQVLGEHFNQVGCHTNTNVVFFALNSLRQLSMRFMEIEELPGFKFQKDFLKPFEHIISNATVVPVKDMVIRCLIQMIQARGENIRSGWRTMFGVFTVAAREPYEGIVNLAFDSVTQVYNTWFGVVISQGAFADLIVCLTEFSKNYKFQKRSFQAIETSKSSIRKVLRTPECPLSEHIDAPKEANQSAKIPRQPNQQSQEEQYWFPVLFAFHDVLMTGEDLEVRSRALMYLFETLTQYGKDFPKDFWDTLWRQLLYPIFMVLRSRSEMSKTVNHEDLSVWLSTTMIEALRHMIKLFTHFFDQLNYMLDRFLELLALCICQENDTLARIGSNCLQQLILENVRKFDDGHWNKIVNAFIELFRRTEASALFSAATSSTYTPSPSLNGGSRHPLKIGETPITNSAVVDSPAQEHPEPNATPEHDPSENPLGINGLPQRNHSASISMHPDDPSIASVEEHARMPSPLPKRTTEDLEDYRPDSDLQQAPVVVTAARRRFFNQIITKCVLQLLMIETVQELFTNEDVYKQIPSPELLRLMQVLKKSYQFAKRFNADKDLRTRLFKEGFMKQPPNLLKQESGSAAVYVSILFRMYHDPSPARISSKSETESALVPLCEDIVRSYIDIDFETQQRNIVTWRPVVIAVLDGFATLAEEDFKRITPMVAGLIVGLLGTEMTIEMQRAVQGLVARSFEVGMGVKGAGEGGEWGLMERTPTSPGSGGHAVGPGGLKWGTPGGRRGSKGR